MKRMLDSDWGVSPSGKKMMMKDWRQDRQPDWQELHELQEKVEQRDECAESKSRDDDDDDDIILRSRRCQQRLDVRTQLDVDGSSGEPPGAPVKKRVRVLPWTEEGRRLWPECGGSESDEETILVADSQAGDLDDDCLSFVVDDDSESVVVEIEASEKFLTREALEDVKTSLMNKIVKLKDRVVRVDEQLRGLDCDELEDSGSDDGEDDGEDECVFHGWAEHSVEGVCMVCYKG